MGTPPKSGDGVQDNRVLEPRYVPATLRLALAIHDLKRATLGSPDMEKVVDEVARALNLPPELLMEVNYQAVNRAALVQRALDLLRDASASARQVAAPNPAANELVEGQLRFPFVAPLRVLRADETPSPLETKAPVAPRPPLLHLVQRDELSTRCSECGAPCFGSHTLEEDADGNCVQILRKSFTCDCAIRDAKARSPTSRRARLRCVPGGKTEPERSGVGTHEGEEDRESPA